MPSYKQSILTQEAINFIFQYLIATNLLYLIMSVFRKYHFWIDITFEEVVLVTCSIRQLYL